MSHKRLVKDLLPLKITSPPVSLGKGDWLGLEYVNYRDDKNVERRWERCIRNQQRPSQSEGTVAVNAIDIHALLLPEGGSQEPEILLVIQYRPAIERYCIEFPSDANDHDPLDCAQRELREETGYLIPKDQFELVQVPVAYEPGLTNSCCYIARVTIDTSNKETSLAQEPALEPDEWSLQSIKLPLNDLLHHLTELQKAQNGLLMIDSRLHAFASALDISKKLSLS
ncbi:hypothetical protein BDF20DRAFT_479678 [Mycotypha africana]|uniref:uncharacterized protein n=1 Tax=Mycotypha africana TaxID=64632 RepID=UPI002301B921|nr:uncharacterized protein BDF20DRAFT_479678 [Mycotypha africana]KAI8979107.1 hypothetical protein BDF20DRAFT_479678 [Mycotypha africana]